MRVGWLLFLANIYMVDEGWNQIPHSHILRVSWTPPISGVSSTVMPRQDEGTLLGTRAGGGEQSQLSCQPQVVRVVRKTGASLPHPYHYRADKGGWTSSSLMPSGLADQCSSATRSALLYCPGKLQCLLSQVLRLVGGKVTSPNSGGEGRVEEDIFPSFCHHVEDEG